MNLKSILFVALGCFVFECGFAQTKRALIVAIGNYPNPVRNKWKVINSLNDVPLIKNALVQNQRFDEKNIDILTDSMATKDGIERALDKLIASSGKGDIVVIHFSSHGEQIEDDNDDEEDGLDEVIVPYGAVFSSDPEEFEKYAPAYFRDDLFGEKVIQIRNKLGKSGDLLVIIDACHSGSGTRGVETTQIRGGNTPMVSNKFSKKNLSNKADGGVFKEAFSVTKLSNDASSYVVISGAQAKESNYECFDDNDNPVGSLSYAFSKSIAALKGDMTYRGLFAQIENVMREKAPKQKPVLEGDGLDKNLFSGRYEKQQVYFSVNNTMSKNGKLAINGGFVSGITKGSVINFYETGTTNITGKTPVGSGKVASVSAYTSMVIPDSAYDLLIKTNPWAFISELSYGTEKLKLFVKDNKTITKLIMDSLKNFQLVEFNPAFDLYLDTCGSLKYWALKYPNSGTVFQDSLTFSPNQNMDALKEALKRFSRYRYLEGLDFNEYGLSADVQLFFLDERGNIDSAKLKARTKLGRLELREDDQVFLRVINTGQKQLFVNIVDIQPNGIINPVLPNKDVKDKNDNPAPITWENCLVKKSDTMFLRNLPIDISRPFGQEIFKVFLSSSPLDLEDILTTRDASVPKNKRGVLSGLETIFISSNITENGTRGTKATKLNTDQNGTVFSVNFQILPK